MMRESLSTIGWERVSTRLGAALLVVSAIFFAANFADKAWLSYQFGQAKHQRLLEISQTEQQIGQLKRDLVYYHSRPYYLREARRYGFELPGDIPIEAVTSGSQSDVAAPAQIASTVTPIAHHQSLLRRILQAIVPGL